jgi:hypothetical protein
MSTPDPASDSLIAALTKVRIPAGNHEFVRQFATAVGISSFTAIATADKPYVRASRHDGLPDLHIFYGYTTGFMSEKEIVRVAGRNAERAPSSRKGTWYVVHPINQVRPAGIRPHNIRREAGHCECGMQLSLTGVCGSCD